MVSDQNVDRLVDKAVEAAKKINLLSLQDLAESYEFALCESPIEQLMLVALASFSDWRGKVSVFPATNFLSAVGSVGGEPAERITINPQVEVGPYRVDFLLVANRVNAEPYLLAVECDGHDFHEKTKQQAARDKARDRYFLSRGIAVMRFTGAEIWADAAACATQVMDLLKQEYGKSADQYLVVCKAMAKQRQQKDGVAHDPR